VTYDKITPVLVNQSERGAANPFTCGHIQPLGDALREACFSRPKLTEKRDHVSGFEPFAKGPSERNGLLFPMSDENEGLRVKH
jgi:hypothetical protein